MVGSINKIHKIFLINLINSIKNILNSSTLNESFYLRKPAPLDFLNTQKSLKLSGEICLTITSKIHFFYSSNHVKFFSKTRSSPAVIGTVPDGKSEVLSAIFFLTEKPSVHVHLLTQLVSNLLYLDRNQHV